MVAKPAAPRAWALAGILAFSALAAVVIISSQRTPNALLRHSKLAKVPETRQNVLG